MSQPIVIDLFGGCGGFSVGFQDAGFRIAGCVEIEKEHAKTYAQNFPNATVINKSIVSVTADELLSISSEIDVICSGSPCQSFSKIGIQDLSDPRGELIWEFARLVRDCSPSYFLMENVDELVNNTKFKPIVDELLSTLRSYGYGVGIRVLDTCNFGVPQSRKRAFFMGTKKGKKRPIFPKPRQIRVNIQDAIADLPEIENFDSLWDSEALDYSLLDKASEYVWRLNRGRVLEQITGMQRTEHSEEVRQRFAQTLPGKIDPVSRFKRLSWRGIAPTLRAGYNSESRHSASRPIHPETPRCISVRESARLQGFPDWHKLSTVKTIAYQQIGNAVSPVIAEAFASEFLSVM